MLQIDNGYVQVVYIRIPEVTQKRMFEVTSAGTTAIK